MAAISHPSLWPAAGASESARGLPRRGARPPRAPFLAAVLGLVTGLGCEGSQAPGREPSSDARPSILWIVWDTVRADRMSVYGYERPTTPYLERWAESARVFENALSVGSTTVPSHASMFSGLLPSQHGADNQHPKLDPRVVTLAELLSAEGYATYLFSANPHLRTETGLTRGFDVAEHPWSPPHRAETRRIVRAKAGARGGPGRAGESAPRAGYATAAGAVAQSGLARWWQSRDPDRPFFVFLNYMEAHAPLQPQRRYRERFLRPDEVDRSFAMELGGLGSWKYTVGLTELSDADLRVIRGTYDAALAELDDLFRALLGWLEPRGGLRNTVVVLTSDHGELLGEHHMLDHQFSLHRQLLEVPLIVHYPSRVPPGREPRPVANLDLFPALLELAGVAREPGRSHAVSLLRPVAERARLAEYPAAAGKILASIRRDSPAFDPTPFTRSLRALHLGAYKYVWASDGRNQLYDLVEDHREQRNLIETHPDLARDLDRRLRGHLDALAPVGARQEPPPAADRDAVRMLEALGYASPRDRARE